MRSPVRVAWRSGTLGVKLEECPACGTVKPHQLERQYRWLEIGPVGVIPLGLRHGLECQTCWRWTPVGWRGVRRAAKSGRLPLPAQPRPIVEAATAAGRRTPDLDRVVPTGSLDGGTVYLGVWVAIAAIAVGLALQPRAVDGEHVAGATCLVTVGLAEGQPVPTPPITVSETLCVFPHNFEPLTKVQLIGFASTATPPPYPLAAERAGAACSAALEAAFGSPAPGGPVAVVAGVDARDWTRGERFTWCMAADPAHPWLTGSLPR